MSSAALSTGDMLTIIGDKRPLACNVHCAAVAAAANAVHNAR